MKARDKFIARLKELGLYEEWLGTDHVGKVLDDGSIVVLIHVDSDPSDSYSEIHYPPFEEVWKDAVSRDRLKQEFYSHDDDHFVAELAYWLDIHKNGAKCPLFPVDLYWAGVKEKEWFDYEDDAYDDATAVIVEMLRYMSEKTGVEIKGNINGVDL